MKKIERMFFEIIGRVWGLDSSGKLDVKNFNLEMDEVKKKYLGVRTTNHKRPEEKE